MTTFVAPFMVGLSILVVKHTDNRTRNGDTGNLPKKRLKRGKQLVLYIETILRVSCLWYDLKLLDKKFHIPIGIAVFYGILYFLEDGMCFGRKPDFPSPTVMSNTSSYTHHIVGVGYHIKAYIIRIGLHHQPVNSSSPYN